MIIEAVKRAWLRFPLGVVWLAVATLGIIDDLINIEIFKDLKNLDLSLIYGGVMGFLATIGVTLWSEFLGKRKNVAVAVASIIVAIDAVIVYFDPSATNHAGIAARLSLGTALLVASLFVPVKGNEGWHFAWRQICNGVVAFLVGQVCVIATLVISMTIELLFDVDCGDQMASIMVICGFTFPALLFIGRMPTPEQNAGQAAVFRMSAFACGLFLYVFLPITIIYLAVFWVYGLKILSSWSLPDGFVTVPGAGLCAAVLFMLFFLEGVRRFNPRNRITLIGLKLLPWLTLPVVLLMSIAIGYRIAQYGFTSPRLYVLIFNVWCWVVFIILGLKENRRYDRVAQSFAIVFAATSILPWANFTNLGKLLERKNSVKPEVVEEVTRPKVLSCEKCPVPEGFRWMKKTTVYRKDLNKTTAVIDNIKYIVPTDSVANLDARDFESFYLRPASGSDGSIYVVKNMDIEMSKDTIVTYLDGYLYTK